MQLTFAFFQYHFYAFIYGIFFIGEGRGIVVCFFLIRVNYAICRYVFVKKKKRKKEHGKKDHQFSALKKEKK